MINVYEYFNTPTKLDAPSGFPTSGFAYRYVKMINKPVPAAEDQLSMDSYYSLWYAKEILKGPFPEGEYKISKLPEYVCAYAELLNKRFILGEPAILAAKYTHYWFIYKRLFPDAPMFQDEVK